ncbi:MAG: DUF192 domain-containing protein [Verrucomicrobiota bacterium]
MFFCHASNRLVHQSRLPLTFFSLCLALTLLGCKADQSEPTEPSPAETYFPIQIGDVTLQLQLALTQPEQQKGLMFRDELATGHGMLFLFEKPEKRGFWMKNTRIPLDIGYFDSSGQLLEVYPLYPYDETSVPSRSDQILIAVETNRGWYKANGVAPEAFIDMDAVKKAVIERGFKVTSFAIEER